MIMRMNVQTSSRTAEQTVYNLRKYGNFKKISEMLWNLKQVAYCKVLQTVLFHDGYIDKY